MKHTNRLVSHLTNEPSIGSHPHLIPPQDNLSQSSVIEDYFTISQNRDVFKPPTQGKQRSIVKPFPKKVVSKVVDRAEIPHTYCEMVPNPRVQF